MNHEDKQAPTEKDAPKAKRLLIIHDEPSYAEKEFYAWLDSEITQREKEDPNWWGNIFSQIEKQKEGYR